MIRFWTLLIVLMSALYLSSVPASTNYYATRSQAQSACIAASPITKVLNGHGSTNFNTCTTYGGGSNTNICIGGYYGYYRLFNSGVYLYYEDQDWAFCLSGSFSSCPSGQSRNPNTGICIPTSENPKNPVSSACPVGNPINFITGNKIADEVDVNSEGLSLLFFKRHYNGLISYQQQTNFGSTQSSLNPLGSRWSHNFHQGLLVVSDQVTLIRADKQMFIFRPVSGLWQPDTDVDYHLEEILTNSVRTGWKVTTPENTIETYSSNGDLLSMTAISGVTQTLVYSNSTTPTTTAPVAGLIIRVTDSFGKSLNFTYDSASRISTMTDPAGQVYRYSYDASGNLKTVTYPDETPLDVTDNPKKTYVYGSDPEETANTGDVLQANLLTGIIDESGVRYATYRYDANGKAISTEHAGGVEKYSLSYSADGSSTTVTDPLGSVRTSQFTTLLGVVKPVSHSQPAGSGCAASASALTYDANGNIASRTDFNGHRTNYSYDLSRNLETSRTEGLTAAGATTPETRTITTAWHPTFRLPVAITEPGLQTTYQYDTKGQMTLKSLKDLATNQTQTWTTDYTYSAAGLLLQKVEDGPRTDISDQTTYDYYPETAACNGGHLGCRGQLQQVTDALGHVTSLTRYSPHGLPEVITDANGRTTTLTYDVRQRLIAADVGGELTTYTYDPAGLMTRVTVPNGAFLTYRYDDAHRLIEIKDSWGNTRTYTLDAMGNRIKEDLTDPNGQLARTQSRVYDALSRLQHVILPQ